MIACLRSSARIAHSVTRLALRNRMVPSPVMVNSLIASVGWFWTASTVAARLRNPKSFEFSASSISGFAPSDFFLPSIKPINAKRRRTVCCCWSLRFCLARFSYSSRALGTSPNASCSLACQICKSMRWSRSVLISSSLSNTSAARLRSPRRDAIWTSISATTCPRG